MAGQNSGRLMSEFEKNRLKNENTIQNTTPSPSISAGSHQMDRLIEAMNSLILPLGYEVVHIELQSHRQKTLRVFIDFSEPVEGKSIGIEDCVAVTRALDEPLDQMPEVEGVFHGNYELEVSSPGVDRPLRQAKDFQRFAGKEARIHTFRPLTAEEMGNPAYCEKNPKQKNFFGTLEGLTRDEQGDRVRLVVSEGPSAKKGTSPKKLKTNKDQEADASSAEISIPLPLISKANLEPKFDFGTEKA